MKNPLKVMFVCRASSREGFGHLFRCQSLIAAAPDNIAPYLVIHGSPNHFYSPDNLAAPETIISRSRDFTGAARTISPDIIVFDLNQMDSGIFTGLSRNYFSVCLSPIFEHIASVNQVFHRSIYLPRTAGNTAVFAGPEYAIISHNCQPIPNGIYETKLAEPQLAVGVSMGGGDAANKTLAILRTLTAYPDKAVFWIFLGIGYSHSYDMLVAESHRNRLHEVVLVKASHSMWSILGNCHMAILAGGVTSYDAAYAGLPAMHLLESEDRRFLLRELVEQEACIQADVFDDISLAKLPEQLTQLNDDRKRLRQIRRNSQTMVDGNGANRIWQQIIKGYQDQA